MTTLKYQIPETGNFTLKQCRHLLDLKRKDAADLIGITVNQLENYERQRTYPTVPIIKKIEEAYGIPYARIIFTP